MAKQNIARNNSRSRTHRRVRGLGLLLVVGMVVSLAMLLAACDSTASSGTSSQSEDVPVEEQAAQDNDKPEPEVEPEPQPEPEPEAEPEPATSNEAPSLSPEEIAQHRAEAQRRHREQPCWVTLAGHSYHESKTCPELDGSMGLIEMTVGMAIDGGYDPCLYCAY